MSIAFYLIAVLTALIGWQSGSQSLMIVAFFGAAAIAVAATWHRNSATPNRYRTQQQRQTESTVPGEAPVSVLPG